MLLALAFGNPAMGETTSPHVIVISLDTARADFFGFMGNETIHTPRIDSLASESIVFTKHETVIPTTLASHTTIFTGKYPHHHGTPGNGYVINSDNVMLAEILQEQGYDTAGFIGSFALDERFNFAQGFDHYDASFDVLVGHRAADQNHRSAESVTNAAIAYLRERKSSASLFLFVHYFDPHHPYLEEGSFFDLYKNIVVPQTIHPERRHENAIAAKLARQYAAGISYTDHHLGRLLLELRIRGLLDDSILVLTTDHGENFLEHGESFNHGLSVYQAATRALWLMRLPKGANGGTRSDRATSSIDILPTLLRQLNLPAPALIDGRALSLAGDPPKARSPHDTFSQAGRRLGKRTHDLPWANADLPRSIRRGNLKLIHTPGGRADELYDVTHDPAEQTNLLLQASNEQTARAESMRAALDAWAASAKPLPSERERLQSRETIERLKSLGYIVD